VPYVFGILRPNVSSPDGNETSDQRRSLLAVRASTTRSQGVVVPVGFKGGYEVVIDDSPIRYNLVPYWDISKNIRCVDAGCSNTLLGGLFLHATHKPASRTPIASDPGLETLMASNLVQDCQSSKFSSLSAICNNQGGTPVASTSTLDASQGKPRPIGVDPVFNPTSPLYIAELNASDYYNISSPLEVNPMTDLPFAFFHQPIPHYPDGYPVFVSEYLSQGRAGQTYEFLRDGNFLDHDFSSRLTMEMVTYNQGARIFGYFSGIANWMDNGDVKMTYTITALPITIDGTASQIVYNAVLIFLICIYIVLAINDTYSAWSIEKKSRWGLKTAKPTSEQEYGEPKVTSDEDYDGTHNDKEADFLKSRLQYSRNELRNRQIPLSVREKRIRAGCEYIFMLMTLVCSLLALILHRCVNQRGVLRWVSTQDTLGMDHL
jgi:hypothetical protein